MRRTEEVFTFVNNISLTEIYKNQVLLTYQKYQETKNSIQDPLSVKWMEKNEVSRKALEIEAQREASRQQKEKNRKS